MPHESGRLVAEIERKIRTREVLEEEDFSTLIIRSTIDGIYSYDIDLTVTLWNPAMERITGVKKSQVLGRNMFDYFPFFEKNGLQYLLLDPLEGKTVHEREVHFDIPETGRRGFARRLSCPLIDDKGNVVGGLCIVHEITDQKHAETKVAIHRRAEKRLKFISEAGMLLSGTLDYHKVLQLVLELSSRHFGAWAKLRLLEEDGTVSAFYFHSDAELNARLAEIERKYPPTEDLKEGPLWVLRNGGQQFFPRFTEEMIVNYAKDAEHLALLRSIVGYICVPLQASGRIFGTFSILGTIREFTEEDLSLAHDLARWIALAIGNARLYSKKI